MLHLHIICLGKLKETYWQEAEAEYLKRLSPFVKLEIHELREESFDEKNPVEIIKAKEAEKIIGEIKKLGNKEIGQTTDRYIVALDEHGKSFSSIEFAKQLNNVAIQQCNNVAFIIGGPLGLDESILKLAKLKLSFSQMTFTHQMIRVFLLEQIYRAQMIQTGRKYHY